MTSPRRMLAVLDLFTQEHPVWAVDDMMTALGYSRATGYRYVKELVDAGFLQKVTAGVYALGGRIIALDYQLRRTDPVLKAAIPAMEQLAHATGFDVVLSVMFAGPQVIDTHRVKGAQQLALTFGRGHPRPLFRSGAPKILLAHLPRGPLTKIYDSHAKEIAANGMGEDWPAFRAYLSGVRKKGMYVSLGELDPGVGAAAVAVHGIDGDVVAALAIVATEAGITALGELELKVLLDGCVAHIEARLAETST